MLKSGCLKINGCRPRDRLVTWWATLGDLWITLVCAH
jgi:hypothetical protein